MSAGPSPCLSSPAQRQWPAKPLCQYSTRKADIRKAARTGSSCTWCRFKLKHHLIRIRICPYCLSTALLGRKTAGHSQDCTPCVRSVAACATLASLSASILYLCCPQQCFRQAALPKEEKETPLQPGHKGTQDLKAAEPFGVPPTRKNTDLRLWKERCQLPAASSTFLATSHAPAKGIHHTGNESLATKAKCM